MNFGSRYLLIAIALLISLNLTGCVVPAPLVNQPEMVEIDKSTPKSAPASLAQSAKFADEPTRSGLKRTIAAGKLVSVINEFGEVRVRFGGFANELEATAVAQAPIGSAMPVMLFDETTATLTTQLPAFAPGAIDAPALAEGQRIDVTLFVPEKHDLYVRTLRGLIEVRGLRGNLQARSVSGDLLLRSISGVIDVETGSGLIEVAFADQAISASHRVVTSTGAISASFAPTYDAELSLATSGLFATEYSLNVVPQPGSEPNKTARATLGRGVNPIEIRSKRGDVRLFRRPVFLDADSDSQ